MATNERVVDNREQRRYELKLEGGTAFIDYTDQGNIRTLTHAEVPLPLRGGGIAGKLTQGALDLARADGIKVVPRCPYVAAFIDRHPQYQDLLSH
jgi:predicted GNAT family acetyltransferase